MKSKRIPFLIFSIPLLCSTPALASIRTWSGAGPNNFWTNAANWGGTAPVAGDDLVFPGGGGVDATSLDNTNNFPVNTAFNSITFTGTGYSLNGNGLALSAGVTNNPSGSGNNAVSCPITLATDQILGSSAVLHSLILNGAITNNGHTLTLAAGTILLNGVISGSGGLESSANTLSINAPNTYTGPTHVGFGVVGLLNGTALGATNSDTIVDSGAILVLQAGVSVPEAIQLGGTLRAQGGSNTVTGQITLTASDAAADVNTNTQLTLSGVVSGAGGLTKQGTGTLVFSGASANTYTGTTTVNGGTVLLNKSPGLAAIPGTLVIGDGAGGVNADVVRHQANAQIADSSAITINSSGLLDTDGFTELTGPVSGSGSLQLDASVFTVNFASGDVAFDGTISGSANLNRIGAAGNWILNGSNTFSGTVAASGNILVDGALPAGLINVVATLGGTGTVGRVSVSASGTLSPGLSPGRLNTSNVTFAAGSQFRVELNGTNAGAGYDQLKVTGAVNNLANSTLNATLGFVSAISNVFTIIDNDGADAVTNTFLGLPEGATVIASGTSFRISYAGGTGNDVTLTQLTATQRPLLSIRSAANTNVVLSWATNFIGYTLEASTNLNTSVWAVVTNVPAVSGTNNVVTYAASGAQKYYHLRAP